MRLLLVALAAVLVLAACGDDDEDVVTRTPTPVPSPTTAEVAWEDLAPLFEDCKVASVMQTHALDVYVLLDDGREIHTKEPAIDDVIFLAQDANGLCGGPISIGTE